MTLGHSDAETGLECPEKARLIKRYTTVKFAAVMSKKEDDNIRAEVAWAALEAHLRERGC